VSENFGTHYNLLRLDHATDQCGSQDSFSKTETFAEI